MFKSKFGVPNKLIAAVSSAMLMMTFVIVLALPQSANADTTSCAIANPRVTDGNTTFKINSTCDLVTFGNYAINSSSTKKPIVWRVLQTDGKTALLLSEYTLYNPIKYNESGASTTWTDCFLR